jgi:simple sugar transport system permease protein
MRYVPISATILVFFVVYLIGIICFENFGSPNVFMNLFLNYAYLGIAAIGTSLVILTGGIDLSVGSIIAFTSILIAKMISTGCNALWAIALALVIGILFGMLQGWLIHSFSLPPFLVTLAGMFFIRGCGFIVSEESIPIKNDPVFNFIQNNLTITLSKGLHLRFIVMLYIVVLIVAVIFSQRTRAGRSIYAIGDNELAATLMGIPVGRTKIMTYTIAGFCSALAGVVYAIYLKAGNPLNCVGLEMDAIAAVVIGGTLLTGGVGYVFGSLFGVLVLGLIQTLIQFNGHINSWWTRIIVGLLVLAFIFMQNLITKISKSRSKTQ